MAPPARSLTLALALSVAAACASTAQRNDLAVDGGLTEDATTPVASADDRATTGTVGGARDRARDAARDCSGVADAGPCIAPAGDAGPTGPNAIGTGTGGAAGNVDGATASAAAGPAVAVDGGATVRIGIHTSRDLQAAYAAFGARGAEGDITPGLRKVVDWINANGGMGGRRVDPVFHASDPLSGTFDAEAQATCSDFADDKRVFAVVSGAVLPTIVTVDCLVKKRVPIVWNYHFLVDGEMWRQYLPYLYMPFGVSADRLGFVVDQLAAGAYFDAGARLAILRYDLPQHERLVAGVLRPRLRAHRVTVAEEIALRPPGSAAAAADTGAQVASAILRLRAADITHVLFVPTGGAVPFLFTSEAESQGFRPRYAMTTLDIPYFVADQAPAAQLRGALAVGWSPPSDVHREQAPPPNEPTARCYELTNSHTAQRFCDGLFFLKAALDRAPTFDAAGLRAAVESMGDSFVPTFSLATRFGRGRHDGASATRLVAYDTGCECFRYAGPVSPIP